MRALPLSLVLLLGGPTFGQESSEPDVTLDKSKPSVYIQYVTLMEGDPGAKGGRLERLRSTRMAESRSGRSGTGARAGPQVRLELFNNTRGAIRIPTGSLYLGEKVRPLGLGDGRGVLALRPRELVSPCYMVRGPAPQELEPGIDERPYQRLYYSCTDVRYMSWIASGESVLFEVPRDHLVPRNRVTVRFDYAWEKEATTIQHQVSFSGSSLRKATGARN